MTNSTGRDIVVSLLVGVIVAPMQIMLHEVGHYLGVMAYGFSGTINYTSVKWFARLPVQDWSPMLYITTISGFMLNYMVGLVGYILYIAHRRGRFNQRYDFYDWLCVIILSGLFRGFRALEYFLGISKEIDESEASFEIGCGSSFIPIWGLVVALIVIGDILYKEKTNSIRWNWVYYGGGGLLGMWLWLKILGKFVLP